MNLDITQEEIEWTARKYGGKFTILNTLEVGTKFHVCNGAWDGEIVEKDGGKWLLVKGDKEPKFKLEGSYYAWIPMKEKFQ